MNTFSQQFNLADIKNYPLATCGNKVSLLREHSDASPKQAGGNRSNYCGALPHLLGARCLRVIVRAVVSAIENRQPVLPVMGGHVIKC